MANLATANPTVAVYLSVAPPSTPYRQETNSLLKSAGYTPTSDARDAGLTFDQLASRVRESLMPDERKGAVAYAAESTVPAGTRLQLPGAPIKTEWKAHIAFVDRDPMANWGHSCRYLLIGDQAGEYRSIEARFPPFPALKGLKWRVVYRAPGVPESVIGVK